MFQSASELEFYVFKNLNEKITEIPEETNLNKHLMSKLHSDLMIPRIMMRTENLTKKFRENVKNCGIIVESTLSENGPGQHEINIKYCDSLKNCDNHTILKMCIKHTADQEGNGITFMAKPFSHQAGSSCHVHISIIDEISKTNIFSAPEDQLDPEYYLIEIEGTDIKVPCNIKMIYFIGGILKYIQELFICYAPTINSYKRFKKYSLAPFYINTWCRENKLSTVKVVGQGQSIHLEVRLGGADVNPYILHTAIICSGMKGIEEKILPPPIQYGNTYEKTGLVSPPQNLNEAAKFFDKSEFAEEVFGKNMKECMVKSAEFEWNLFMEQVSQWEVNRYLDLV